MAEAHQHLEQLVGVDLPPGTEVMRDVEGYEFVKTKRGVLVPQPSDLENDPLNWTPFWKYATLATAVLLGFSQGFPVLSTSTQVPEYVAEWDLTPAQVINFTGVTILILGFSNLFWVPICTQFGRRPCALLSSLVCLAASIWRAQSQSYESFYAATFIHGFAAGPGETYPGMVISDIVFIDHRGFWLGCYWGMYFSSQMVGPIVGGVMAQKYGWRSFWYLNVALYVFMIVLIFFFGPETKFSRVDVPESEIEDDKVTNEHADVVERHVDTHLGKGKPSRQQFMPWQPFSGSLKSLMHDVVTPFYLMLFPIVEWTSFSVSWASSCFLCANLTMSGVFGAPPYNWDSNAVGLSGLAILVGAFLGFATAGPCGDFVCKILTRRNNGIREPEQRLWALLPFCVILTIGSVVVSLGYDNKWPWQVIVFVGFAALGWQVAAIPPLSIAYAVDSYKPIAGEILITVTINKNLWGYGLSEFINQWGASSGWVTPIMTNTGITLAIVILGSAVLMFFGKTFRRWTKDSYVHRVG